MLVVHFVCSRASRESLADQAFNTVLLGHSMRRFTNQVARNDKYPILIGHHHIAGAHRDTTTGDALSDLLALHCISLSSE
jgi:hypothetical protein